MRPGRGRCRWFRQSRRSSIPPRREPRVNDESAAYSVDKYWLRRSFERASTTYDDAAVLQAAERDLRLRRLELTNLSPGLVIDAGSGTGHAGRALKRRYPSAQVLPVDSSFGML